MAHVAKKEKSEGAELLQDVIRAFQLDETLEMHVAEMRSMTSSLTSKVLFSVLDFYHLDFYHLVLNNFLRSCSKLLLFRGNNSLSSLNSNNLDATTNRLS